MDSRIILNFGQMFLFFSIWYFFTITTYGTNVPAGLFLPGMIIGCALGAMYSKAVDLSMVFAHDLDYIAVHDDIRKKYIVIGCAGFMAGYTRMTYSLAVILMETSQDLTLFVPIIFTILISNQVGYRFTRSLYQRATRTKQMPILSDKIPAPCKFLKAGDLMSTDVVSLKMIDTVKNI